MTETEQADGKTQKAKSPATLRLQGIYDQLALGLGAPKRTNFPHFFSFSTV
jgi:hypothetical protein